MTYSFCLFFGPGLGLDFMLSSTPSPSSRFVPVFGPELDFWLVVSRGVSGSSGRLGAGDALISDLAATALVFSVKTGGVCGDGDAGGGGFA